jgi:uncharacterized coiled-coil DUF342 family protein
MSLIEELETKVPKLSTQELAQFRDWLDRYVEDHLELRDEVKAELDEAWREIDTGNCRVRETRPG